MRTGEVAATSARSCTSSSSIAAFRCSSSIEAEAEAGGEEGVEGGGEEVFEVATATMLSAALNSNSSLGSVASNGIELIFKQRMPPPPLLGIATNLGTENEVEELEELDEKATALPSF